uniref:pyranose dehydrogenase (acceptor) n=1 Tax=Psilocybe cubensis TaxID=181762 RepID=A0A8H8CLS0_PSICU
MSTPSNTLAPAPDALQLILQKLNAYSGAKNVFLSGVALAIFLRLCFQGKKSKGYTSNLDKVGQRTEVASQSGPGGQYDIIVVGGGTSGCALAARLSEDPNLRVLLLEAGGSGKALSDSSTPAGFGRLLYNAKHVHQLRTESQVAAGGKVNFWPRAKMLGGCSSINAQMAQYGAFGDFDEWATYIEDDSWSWKNISQYFRRFEAFQPHPDYPEVDASARGLSGPVHVGFYNTVTKASHAFIKSCVAVGIPFTADFNGKNGTIGAGRIMTYVDKNYKRVSAETAYLTPEVLARPNLTVAINATVTRILFDKSTNPRPRAIGVEFGRKEGGQTWQAFASKEVVLSGGAVHSPHILLLSGIGASTDLKKHGITPILDLPGVGKRLVDHPVVDLFFKDKHNVSAKYLKPRSLKDFWKVLNAVVQYKLGKGGPLAMNFGESAAFVRSDDPRLFPKAEFPDKLVDSTSAADSPDLEIFSTPFAYKEHGQAFFDVHTYGLHIYLLRPMSHGEVLLKSRSPWALPSVNPNYLSAPEDVAKLARGVKLALRIAQADPLASHLDSTFTRTDFDHQLHLRSDDEINALVRERVETVYHPASTCRMAPKEDGGVVDGKLRVYGVDGLRVCDASVFPWIISGHTVSLRLLGHMDSCLNGEMNQAGGCFAIAEKLAEEMKGEYGGIEFAPSAAETKVILWLWSGEVTTGVRMEESCGRAFLPSVLPLILAFNTPPKAPRSGLAAKVGALIRLKRPVRRNTDPGSVQLEQSESGHREPHQDERATINIPPIPVITASPSSTPVSSLAPLPSQQQHQQESTTHHSPPPLLSLQSNHDPAMLQPQSQFRQPAQNKQNHKSWWNHFALISKPKKDLSAMTAPYKAHDTADHPVFGKPLKESLRYASVQISTANANGDLYVWGYIPVVVAKCGLYLKENATEVPGTFRVNGSNKRMRDLQAIFESPPRLLPSPLPMLVILFDKLPGIRIGCTYGKSLDWKQETYTTHDVASVFRRYLTQMPEPVIPYDMYHLFRDALSKKPFNQEEVISTYKSLIRKMPRPNQYLLLYVLDLLSVFARKSDKNLMTATNLAVIFRPGILSHPQHEMSPQEHALSQRVLEFLIAQQDWFMLDISPPPSSSVTTFEGGGAGPSGSGGQGGSGPGGKWHEGSNTPGPSRRGTGASMDNNSTPLAGQNAGSNQVTRQANAYTNAEAGPSKSSSPQMESVGRHRVVSGPSGPLPSITPVSPLITPWLGSTTKSPPNQPTQWHQRQRSLSHSPPSPISNENINPNWASRPPMQQHSQSQPVSQKATAKGYLTENMSSQPSSPHSSQPPSPSSPVFPIIPHHRQPHTRSTSADQAPTKSSSHPRPSSKTPAYPSPLAFNTANHVTFNAPIHARFSHTQTHPYEPPISSSLPPIPSSPLGSGSSDVDEFMVIPSSGEEVSGVGGGWKLVSKGFAAVPANGRSQGSTGTGFMVLGKKDKGATLKMIRRRTAVDPSELIARGGASTEQDCDKTSGGATVMRSKTLPSRKKGSATDTDTAVMSQGIPPSSFAKASHGVLEQEGTREGNDSRTKRVLKKQRRGSGSGISPIPPHQAVAITANI